jgi:prophage maintenance system killer protein
MSKEKSNINMFDKQYLIDTNKKILERHRRLTGEIVWIGTTKTIDDILPHVNSIGNFGNKREDVVEKATHLMAKITHAQPFEDGNRRTGIISAMQFLRDNGYELEIESGQANLDLRKMLKEIKMHMRGLHKETLEQISFYISKRIVSL